MTSAYQLVQLPNGAHSVRSLAHGETFHPVIGPVAEAEALYVRQLRLPERLATQRDEFVMWDVGLGAGANVLTALRAVQPARCAVRVVSFDRTLAPLRFALEHAATLGYFGGYESAAAGLLEHGRVSFTDGGHAVEWTFEQGDFPSLLREANRPAWAVPHAILFDAFSPAKNPEMWTQPLFAAMHRRLDSQRPCALATYSRSTMLRVSLLLAGFFVGAGHATGEKEETTIAANTRALIDAPLDRAWLARARRSTSAEPLWEPVYRQARLSAETWEQLQEHPQFTA